MENRSNEQAGETVIEAVERVRRGAGPGALVKLSYKKGRATWGVFYPKKQGEMKKACADFFTCND